MDASRGGIPVARVWQDGWGPHPPPLPPSPRLCLPPSPPPSARFAWESHSAGAARASRAAQRGGLGWCGDKRRPACAVGELAPREVTPLHIFLSRPGSRPRGGPRDSPTRSSAAAAAAAVAPSCAPSSPAAGSCCQQTPRKPLPRVVLLPRLQCGRTGVSSPPAAASTPSVATPPAAPPAAPSAGVAAASAAVLPGSFCRGGGAAGAHVASPGSAAWAAPHGEAPAGANAAAAAADAAAPSGSPASVLLLFATAAAAAGAVPVVAPGAAGATCSFGDLSV